MISWTGTNSSNFLALNHSLSCDSAYRVPQNDGNPSWGSMKLFIAPKQLGHSCKWWSHPCCPPQISQQDFSQNVLTYNVCCVLSACGMNENWVRLAETMNVACMHSSAYNWSRKSITSGICLLDSEKSWIQNKVYSVWFWRYRDFSRALSKWTESKSELYKMYLFTYLLWYLYCLSGNKTTLGGQFSSHNPLLRSYGA